MNIYCNICDYTATTKSNLKTHLLTQKHINFVQLKSVLDKQKLAEISNELADPENNLAEISIKLADNANQIICKNCEKIFKHESSLSRHKAQCSNNNFIERELKLKLEFSEKEKELYQKLEKEKSDLLKDFMANANVLLNKANDNTKITAQAMQSVSVSALKYANDKFKDTPMLLPLNNFNINNLDFNNVTDKEQLIETLIYCAKQQSLDKLLGDHIVKCYKKENPEEQSFHTTDCSRLNYIVRDLIENALTWAVDKSGLKICKEIVKPLIKKCIDILLEHQKVLLKDMGSGNYHKQKDVELIIDVIMSIDSGELETEINKYIAPYFNLKR
jgi:hypothetical protein